MAGLTAASSARAFRLHAWAFVLANVALNVLNWLGGRPWWAFWPLLVWGIGLGIHYLLYRARTIDEAWVDARTAELHAKSYDVSHIDSIAGRATDDGLATGPDAPRPPARPG